jgi:hypothetical protein
MTSLYRSQAREKLIFSGLERILSLLLPKDRNMRQNYHYFGTVPKSSLQMKYPGTSGDDLCPQD